MGFKAEIKKDGDRAYVSVDPNVLSEMGWDEDTAIELTVEGAALRITPKDESFSDALAEINQKYKTVLQNLA